MIHPSFEPPNFLLRRDSIRTLDTRAWMVLVNVLALQTGIEHRAVATIVLPWRVAQA